MMLATRSHHAFDLPDAVRGLDVFVPLVWMAAIRPLTAGVFGVACRKPVFDGVMIMVGVLSRDAPHHGCGEGVA